jgi:hypothetical protein
VRAVALLAAFLLALPVALAQAQTCPPGTQLTSAGCVTLGEAMGVNAPPPPTVIVVTPTPTVLPTPPALRPPVSGAYVFDQALSAAYAPIGRAPDRAAFTPRFPPGVSLIADPRTLSIVLHTNGPLSYPDDRVLMSSSDVVFTALPAPAYGPQPPPPPCRGGLIYSGPGNARSGDLGAGSVLVPGQPSLFPTAENQSDTGGGDCNVVTYTVQHQ